MLYVKVGLAFLLIVLVAAVFILPNMVTRYEPDPVKRREDSLRSLEKRAKKKPKSADAWCRWGNALVNCGREEPDSAKKPALFEEARQRAEKATQCDAKHTEAWMVWGHALYNLSETETEAARKQELLKEALSKYREAARLKPDYINAWYNLGYMQRQLAALEKGAQQAGVPDNEQGMKLDPEHGDPKAILVDCARVAMTQGDKAGCRAMLEQCRKELGPLDEKELEAIAAFDSVREEDWFKALCAPAPGTTSGM